MSEHAYLIAKMGFSAKATQRDIWWINRLHIVEKTGWTLDYIDSLPFETLALITSIWAGEAKAQGKG